MTEISCRDCGAQNPTQSKFCNRCGAPLTSDTTQLCPTCNTPNSINLLYCDNCGTRLVDDTLSDQERDTAENTGKGGSRSEPFSLPTRPPGQTGNLDVSGEIPDWLKTGDFSSGSVDDHHEDEETDWIGEVQQGTDPADKAPKLDELSSDHTSQGDLPTWLMDENSAGDIFRSEKSTDELFMASFLSSDDATPRETGSILEGDVPEWLQGLSNSDEGSLLDDRSQDLPSNLSDQAFTGWSNHLAESVEEPEFESSPAQDPTRELHNWLEDMETTEQSPSDHDNETGGATATADSPVMEEDDFLRWLSGIQEEEAAVANEADELSSVDEREAPDWIQEPFADRAGSQDDGIETQSGSGEAGDQFPIETESGDHTRSLSDPPRGNSSEGPAAEDEFLEWLDSLDTEELTFTTSETDFSSGPQSAHGKTIDSGVAFSEMDFALPEWLGDLAEPAVTTTQPTNYQVEALPEWLQELAPPGGGVSLPYLSETEGAEYEDAFDDSFEEVDGVEAEGSEPEEEASGRHGTHFPDWLTGVTAELEQPGGTLERIDEPDFEVLAAGGLQDQEVPQEDLPDWFSDVLADIETVDDLAEASVSSPELANVPPQLAGDELPEWLDSPFSDETVAEPTPMEEIPEWLRTPLREKLALAAEERGLDVASLDSGDEWRELLEAPPTPEEMPKRIGHQGVRGWLELIKSRAASPSGDEAESENTVDGSSGPMAGMHDLIGIAPIVAHSGRLERPRSPGASKEQEHQITLLRQLARTQQTEAIAISPGRYSKQSRPALARLLLSALLVAAILFALLAPEVLQNIVPAGAAPAPLAESLISEAAGQPVLVVFDYTPAMSGVLQPSAANLLQRLENQNSPAILTSLSAAGLALGKQAAAGSDLVVADDLGFIPGGTIGVRRLGRCLLDRSFCQMLFGRQIAPQTADRLENIALVILITADRDSFLAWIEQLDPQRPIALSALVTPALEPLAAPYLASGQLTNVSVGFGVASTDNSENASNTTTALILSQWLVVAAFIAGAIFYLVTGTVRTRRV